MAAPVRTIFVVLSFSAFSEIGECPISVMKPPGTSAFLILTPSMRTDTVLVPASSSTLMMVTVDPLSCGRALYYHTCPAAYFGAAPMHATAIAHKRGFTSFDLVIATGPTL